MQEPIQYLLHGVLSTKCINLCKVLTRVPGTEQVLYKFLLLKLSLKGNMIMYRISFWSVMKDWG